MDFNPRSREGSDVFRPIPGDPVDISIHAPAKGATVKLEVQDSMLQFQSTLPRRERQTSRNSKFELSYFNPRSREGSDPLGMDKLLMQVNFNPRSREGSDAGMPGDKRFHPYFNPRSREGSDKTIRINFYDITISIHAPAKGATAIFHKIINLYCKTSTNTTRINSLNINKKYINRIKARILNYSFGANHLINLCKLYIRTCNL